MDAIAFKAYQDALLLLINHMRMNLLGMAATKQRQVVEKDVDEIAKLVSDQSRMVEYVLTERGR